MAIAKKEGPEWLTPFLAGHYFSHCKYHATRRNERNHFCIDCVKGPLCAWGLQRHGSHGTLQVRKASHMNAVRVRDIQKYLDVSDIQLYSINGAKIMFLVTTRPSSKVPKAGFHFCEICERSIADPVRFCSIACKLACAKQNVDDTTLSLSVNFSPFQGDMKKNTLGRDCLCAEEPFTPPLLEEEMRDVDQTTPKSWKRRIMEQWQTKPLDLHWKKAKIESYSKNACVYTPSPEFLPSLHEVFWASGMEMTPPLKIKPSAMTFLAPQAMVFAPLTPESEENVSFRSRSRKGTPHRSPLT